METILVVVRSFGLHAIGDCITEPGDVAATLASPHADHVVAVRVPTIDPEH